MSHQPERKEKDCLNCNAIVQGRFCHVCGQENIITKDSFLGLIKHFFEDLIHFDGKFFVTLKYLLFRPGFVPKEFVSGRRQSYVHPIRMYLFTSAVFFLIFFNFQDLDLNIDKGNNMLSNKTRVAIDNDLRQELKASPGDSDLIKKIVVLMDTSKPLSNDSLTSRRKGALQFSDDEKKFRTVAEYDSFQNTLKAEDRTGWIEQKFKKRVIEINDKYGGDEQKIVIAFAESLLHKLPYLFFVSLPFFAMLLKLLYFRRKTFYYSDHSTFTLYHFIFSFILLFFILVMTWLKKWLGWSFFNWMIFALVVWWAIYFFKGLRIFYEQSRLKTFVKFLILNLFGYILIVVLFMIFLLLSVFQF